MSVTYPFQLMQRLLEWATWVQCRVGTELGYPRQSLEARLREEGGLWRGLTKQPLPTHVNAEEVEAWLCTLAQQYPAQATVVRTFYRQRGTLSHKAKRCGLTTGEFKALLDQGHFWLAGYWTANTPAHQASEKIVKPIG